MENNDATLNELREWLISQGKSNNTVKTYISVIEAFNGWLLKYEEKMDLKKVNEDQIQAYIDFLENKQLSPGTIEKTYAVISVFTKFLGKPQLMVNIVRMTVPRSDEAPESLDPRKKEMLLKQVEIDGNIRNSVIVHILLQTGIRVSELCSLDQSDVLLDDEKGKLVVKNEKGEIDRTIPISKELRMRLRGYIETLDAKDGPLFLSSLKTRMTARSVQYMLQKYDVNPHKLRHTFCQDLINHGVDIRTVAKLAGHRDINVTKRYYKQIEEDLESAINQTFA